MVPWTKDDWANLRIVVVDDSKAVRSMMNLMLRSLGVGEVLLYETVAEAMESIAVQPPDLVISDYFMVPETGLDLLQRLRDSSDALTRELPFLMMSGYDNAGGVDELERQSISGFMPKPVTATLVRDYIISACSQRIAVGLFQDKEYRNLM
ncbi:response regulator [Kiloniella laminariae]|uniref:response regulator n=1 Tax=Kiloniella laminariae TaxID=454162 RepID=UPI00037D4CF9|nr:response regulator [Kiloniella laminariae]